MTKLEQAVELLRNLTTPGRFPAFKDHMKAKQFLAAYDKQKESSDGDK